MTDERRYQLDQSGFADGFVAGHYLHARRGHVALPVRVWFGPAPDVENGGDMDRAWRWNVELAGVVLDDERTRDVAIAELEDVWPVCAKHPVQPPETEYRHARIDHARRWDAHDPFGHPRGRIDLLTATIPE